MKLDKDFIKPCKVQNQTENSHFKKLEYFRPNIVRLDLPFILTEHKMLVLGMSYLKLEGQHVDAVRLIDIWDNEGYVFLKIENLQTRQVNEISWLLEYEGDYWLWSIASCDYIINSVEINNRPNCFLQ